MSVVHGSVRPDGLVKVSGPTWRHLTVRRHIAPARPTAPALPRTAGMLCCRNVRGRTDAISNHAWGTAIDVKIDGVLVPRRAKYANLGLQLLAPIFNKHGWYWGAVFDTPDPHHFECGAELLATFDV